MTEREMGTILTKLEGHKDQLNRIEQTIAINSERAGEEREKVLARMSRMESWQARLAGATALVVFVVPFVVSAVLK
jgi:hypothetical protein